MDRKKLKSRLKVVWPDILQMLQGLLVIWGIITVIFIIAGATHDTMIDALIGIGFMAIINNNNNRLFNLYDL